MKSWCHNWGQWYINEMACPREPGKTQRRWPSWGGTSTWIQGFSLLKLEIIRVGSSCRDILTNDKEARTTRARINQIKPDETSRWDYKGCQGQEERMSSVIRAWGQRNTLEWPIGQLTVSCGKSVGCSKPLSRYVSPREQSDICPIVHGVTPVPLFF